MRRFLWPTDADGLSVGQVFALAVVGTLLGVILVVLVVGSLALVGG